MSHEQLYFDFYPGTLDLDVVYEKQYLTKVNSFFDDISSGLEEVLDNPLEKRIKELEEKGFDFLQGWSMDFYAPDRIVLPSGKIMNFEELGKYVFSPELKKDFNGQAEALLALEYWSLVDSVPYSDERHGNYSSFLNDEDEKTARAKYNKPKLS